MRGKFWLLLLVILLLLFWVIPTSVIKIKHIDCSSQFGECSQEIIRELEAVEKTNYKKTRRQLTDVLKRSILVDQYNTWLTLPSTIRVNVIETKPKYALSDIKESVIALINSQGVVVAFTETSNLPVLIIDGLPPNLGEKVSDKQLFALELAFSVASVYEVNKQMLFEDRLEVELSGTLSQRVIFPLEGERDVLLGALSLILSRLKVIEQDSRIEKGKIFQTIDLRFKNPVLR